MEHVDFVSKKAAERFKRDATKEGWHVELQAATVKHLGNTAGFTRFATGWLSTRRTHAEVHAG